MSSRSQGKARRQLAASRQLGSSLGIALVGAIVLGGLSSAFLANVQTNDRISADDLATVESAIEDADLDFLPVSTVEAAAQDAGLAQHAMLDLGR